jgi:hypothetical protein
MLIIAYRITDKQSQNKNIKANHDEVASVHACIHSSLIQYPVVRLQYPQPGLLVHNQNHPEVHHRVG